MAAPSYADLDLMSAPGERHWAAARAWDRKERAKYVSFNARSKCWAVCLTWQGRTCHVGAFEDRVEAIAWSLHAIDEKAAGRRPTVVPSKGRQEAKKPTALAFTDAELREHAVGLVNRRKHVEGVGHDRRGDRWRAEIRFRGVAVQLGRHEQRADAICARLRAEVDKHEGRWPRDAIHPPARYSALLTGVSGGAGGAGGADGAGGTGGRAPR